MRRVLHAPSADIHFHRETHSIHCVQNADGGGVGCGDGRPIHRFEECRCHFWRIHMIKFKTIVPRMGDWERERKREQEEKRGMRHFSVVSPSVWQSRTFCDVFLAIHYYYIGEWIRRMDTVRNDSDRNLVPTINFVIVFFSSAAERVALCALHTRHTQRERETHSDWHNLCMLNTFPCIVAAKAEPNVLECVLWEWLCVCVHYTKYECTQTHQ